MGKGKQQAAAPASDVSFCRFKSNFSNRISRSRLLANKNDKRKQTKAKNRLHSQVIQTFTEERKQTAASSSSGG